MLRSAAFVIAMIAMRVARADPDDLIAKPLVLAPGHVDAFATLEDDISSGVHDKPLSLSPDVWVGVLPELTVGVIHSDLSVDRIGPGASFCIETQRIICPNAYHGTGLDALYSVATGASPRSRARSRTDPRFSPVLLAGRHARRAAALASRPLVDHFGDPFVQIGLDNNRYGNYSAIWLPVVFAMQPIEHVAIELHTGWNSDFYDINDGWYTPAALGVRGAITQHWEVGALFGWLTIFGPQNDEKLRVLMFDVGWHE